MTEIRKTTLFDVNKMRASSAEANYQPTKGIHHHTHHEILMIQKGSGFHIIDDIKHTVQDNQIFFLKPGQSHQFMPDPGSKFYFVAIDQEGILLNTIINLDELSYFQSFSSQQFIIVDDISPFITLIKAIESGVNLQEKQANRALITSSYMTILLLELQASYDKQVDSPQKQYSTLVKSFFKSLEGETYFRFVKEVADTLFVSANYLNECIKSETGHPASFWIQNKAIKQAQMKLSLTDLSIKEIANTCGYSNATHFTRFFKQHTGQTPKEFRR